MRTGTLTGSAGSQGSGARFHKRHAAQGTASCTAWLHNDAPVALLARSMAAAEERPLCVVRHLVPAHLQIHLSYNAQVAKNWVSACAWLHATS